MKAMLVCLLLAAPILFCGCSSPSPKFTAYHGDDVFAGKGGAVRPVDEMDFWDGEPYRKYRILGLLEAKSGGRVPLGPLGRFSKVFSGSDSDPESKSEKRDEAIAKIARRHQADAVIVVGGSGDPSLDGESRHSHGNRQSKKFLLIKYAE